jgi:2-polyprenyl-3-methyl-5-hydroxy-6-metoxy-1,4-benzoquinol methylase
VNLNSIGYDALGERYYDTWRQDILTEAVERFLRHVPRLAEGARLLDIACGPAIYLKAFHHLGLSCVGGDISPRMLSIAARVLSAELAGPNPPELKKMDMTNLPEELGEFDAIWCSAALAHIARDSLAPTLKRFRGLLRAAGALYISTRIGHGIEVRPDGRTFFFYADSELRRAFQESGLEIVEEWEGTSKKGSTGDMRTKIWKHYVLQKEPLLNAKQVRTTSSYRVRARDLSEKQ